MLNEEKPNFWQILGKAITDPNSQFSIPIKIPVELDKKTNQTVLLAAGLLAGGLIVGAIIYSNKKR
jgi:hypothetical protein